VRQQQRDKEKADLILREAEAKEAQRKAAEDELKPYVPHPTFLDKPGDSLVHMETHKVRHRGLRN